MRRVKNIVRLDAFRISMSPGLSGSRPKYQITTPAGDAYFKFKMRVNEVGAELITFQLGKALGLEMAETYLASYKGEVGVVSLDVGEYEEPDDSETYSVKDFLHIGGFVEMCFLDYLVMNEDRHTGNWGSRENAVAPLFDHNNCFGGEEGFTDFDHFMVTVTSYFCVHTEYDQRHMINGMMIFCVSWRKNEWSKSVPLWIELRVCRLLWTRDSAKSIRSIMRS